MCECTFIFRKGIFIRRECGVRPNTQRRQVRLGRKAEKKSIIHNSRIHKSAHVEFHKHVYLPW